MPTTISRDTEFIYSFTEFMASNKKELDIFYRTGFTLGKKTNTTNMNSDIYHLISLHYNNHLQDMFNRYYEQYSFQYMDSESKKQYSYVTLHDSYFKPSYSGNCHEGNIIYVIEVKYQPGEQNNFPFPLYREPSTLEREAEMESLQFLEMELDLLQLLE
jgi:hypothetical protein